MHYQRVERMQRRSVERVAEGSNSARHSDVPTIVSTGNPRRGLSNARLLLSGTVENTAQAQVSNKRGQVAGRVCAGDVSGALLTTKESGAGPSLDRPNP